MRTLLGNERGLSLAEVLAAIAIISVGLVALSSAIPLAAYGIQEGNQLSTATFLANQRIEQVRNATWKAGPPVVDNLGTSVSSTTPPTNGVVTTFPDESPLGAPYAGYTRTVRITSCAAGAGCGGVVNDTLRQVTVTVSYRPMTGIGVAAAGTTKSAIVTMYISQR